MSDWENDLFSLLEPDNSKKRNRHHSSEEESEGEISDDPEWKEVQSWSKKDLMGDAADRKRLFNMSELEREMELAERRKKLDRLEERSQIKKKVQLQKHDQLDRPMTDREKKGQTLENLRRKREKRISDRSSRVVEQEVYRRRDRSDSDESDYDDKYQAVKMEEPMSHTDAIALQLTRDELETWLYKPNFERTIKGCLAKVSLGVSGEVAREQVYRCVYITDTSEYHRTYKLNKSSTRVALEVSHGKAKRQYLMDMISNQPITLKEWNRYEATHKVEKLPLPTRYHIDRKKEDLEKIRSHVFTDEEINAMIRKKRELKSVVGNVDKEALRIRHELQAAEQAGDRDTVEKLEERLEELEEMSERKKITNSRMDKLAELNEKNRLANLELGQQAEKEALIMRRKQGGNTENDPFARRKTAPVHVISG
ncbi:hypothetical protein BC833DRAFT_609181 [Globomyces pollinis-pini]|nr:hypothetical protein BC833DRAFT_609181 [Globomyces pollinis-pini]